MAPSLGSIRRVKDSFWAPSKRLSATINPAVSEINGAQRNSYPPRKDIYPPPKERSKTYPESKSYIPSQVPGDEEMAHNTIPSEILPQTAIDQDWNLTDSMKPFQGTARSDTLTRTHNTRKPSNKLDGLRKQGKQAKQSIKSEEVSRDQPPITHGVDSYGAPIREIASHDGLTGAYHNNDFEMPDYNRWHKNDLVERITALYVENRVLNSDNAILRESTTNAAFQINMMHTHNSFNRDDSYFENSVLSLRYNIKNFTLKYFSDATEKSASKTKRENISRLTFNREYAEELFMDKDYRPLLIEAYIWSQLVSKVFGECKMVWAGSMNLPLSKIQQKLDIRGDRNATESALKQYHEWRAATFGLVQQHVRPLQVEQGTSYDERQEIGKISAELRWLQKYSQTHWSTLEIGLTEIVTNAVDLDAEMKRQTADYFIFWKDASTFARFRNDRMDALIGGPYEDDKHYVSFVIRPWLYKRGSASGEYYLQDALPLLKGDVLVYPKPIGSSPDTSPPQEIPRRSTSLSRQSTLQSAVHTEYAGPGNLKRPIDSGAENDLHPPRLSRDRRLRSSSKRESSKSRADSKVREININGNTELAEYDSYGRKKLLYSSRRKSTSSLRKYLFGSF